MDQLLIDVTEIPEAQVSDLVTLLGREVRAEMLAELQDTTPHEVTTRIMTRVPRRYIRD